MNRPAMHIVPKCAYTNVVAPPKLGNGEYRTVLAQQRTFLAFIRTALAVTAAFKSNVSGVILGCVVLGVGTLQYVLVMPMFL